MWIKTEWKSKVLPVVCVTINTWQAYALGHIWQCMASMWQHSSARKLCQSSEIPINQSCCSCQQLWAAVNKRIVFIRRQRFLPRLLLLLRERVDWSSDWQQMDTALPVGGRLKKILSMNVSLLRTWILDGCSLLPFTAHWWNESGSCHAYQESGQVARYRPKWPSFHIEKIFWG